MRALVVLFVVLTLVAAGARGKYLEKNQPFEYHYLPTLSLEDLVILRNSIFARYGYPFKSTSMREYFTSLGWYRPNPNFSYAMLTVIDQANVKHALREEELQARKLRESLDGMAVGQERYFLVMRARERIPRGVEGEIMNYWRRNAAPFVVADLGLPVMLAANLSDEKNSAFIQERVKNCPQPYVYWQASYDGSGAIRRLRRYVCEQGSPTAFDDTYYFDDAGKTVMVRGRVRGTTVNYQYYYQYIQGRVAWIELTIINGSAGIADIKENFFY